jgi:hypothetical protein
LPAAAQQGSSKLSGIEISGGLHGWISLQAGPFPGKTGIYIGWNPAFAGRFGELGHTSAQLTLLADLIRSQSGGASLE